PPTTAGPPVDAGRPRRGRRDHHGRRNSRGRPRGARRAPARGDRRGRRRDPGPQGRGRSCKGSVTSGRNPATSRNLIYPVLYLLASRRSHLTLVALLVAAFVGVFFLGWSGSPIHKPLKEGLDLKGGLEVVLQAKPPRGHTLTPEDMDLSVR